jgi:hypothetical protein
MFRRRVKGTGYKAASNPDAEPDLYAVKSMDEVMRSMKTNEEMVAAAVPANITSSCEQSQQQQMTQPVVVQYQQQVESALVNEQATVQPMGSSPSFYPVFDHSSSVVTQSTLRSSMNSESTRASTNSEYSSSEESSCPQDVYSYQQQQSYNQWTGSNTSSCSSMVAQAPMSNNFVMPAQQQLQAQQQPQQQVQQEDSYDRFFTSLNEPPQDSFLREFFGSNDVTPVAPSNGGSQQQQQMSQAPSMAVVNNAARTTTSNNASTGVDQGILMEFADLWENASSRLS